MTPNVTRALLLLAVASWVCAAGFGQNSPPSDKQAPPANPSHASLPQDKHDGLAVSAKPYTDTELAKAKFGKANPLAVGILPVEVFLHNESLQPIRVDVSTIQLSVNFPNGKHQDLDWLSANAGDDWAIRARCRRRAAHGNHPRISVFRPERRPFARG
jgi:hypothetical protein